DKKLGEFINPAGNLFGCPKLFRVVAEQFRVVVSDHGRAGAGRGDDRVATTAEYREEMLGSAFRFGNIAGIVGRLPATGLALRKGECDAEPVEDTHHCLADLWKKGVYQACSKQLYVHTPPHSENRNSPPPTRYSSTPLLCR